jgi:hypothetical protein
MTQREMTELNELASDLCDGFPEKNQDEILAHLVRLVTEEGYSVNALWRIDLEDSGKLYDLIYGF